VQKRLSTWSWRNGWVMTRGAKLQTPLTPHSFPVS
jgi:hypothetical protein